MTRYARYTLIAGAQKSRPALIQASNMFRIATHVDPISVLPKIQPRLPLGTRLGLVSPFLLLNGLYRREIRGIDP